MKIKRFWGAYGTKQIDDANAGPYVPVADGTRPSSSATRFTAPFPRMTV